MTKFSKHVFIKAASVLAVFIIAFTIMFAAQLPEAAFFTSDNTACNEIILITRDDNAAQTATRLLNQAPVPYTVTDSLGNYCLITTEASKDDLLLEYLASSADVLVAEYNSVLALSGITNDEYSDAQWPLHNAGGYTQYGDDGSIYSFSSVYDIDMNIHEAWAEYAAAGYPENDVIVAIIDTGVDYSHPDLAENMWINTAEIPDDGIDNDNNGYIDDIYGWDFYNGDNSVCHYSEPDKNGVITSSPSDPDDHGTHCAGIIAAVSDNNIGIAGIASNVNIQIMSLKIHGGVNSKGTIANAIKAIKYASIMGADICNLSWGTTVYSEALEMLIRESDMLFVAAAGNEGTNIDETPLYPASFDIDNLISVTYNTPDGIPTWDTNFGTSVDMSAPGVYILSTVVGGYDSMSGSSMAAPHISAVAAILYSTGTNYAPQDIKNLIISTAKPLPAFEGLIANACMPDVFKALTDTSVLKQDYTAPVLTFRQSFDNENFIINIDADDKSGSGVRTIKYAPGTKTIKTFRHGTVGTSIKDSSVTLTKSGEYTFYVSDYSGNESIFHYTVTEDETPPDIVAYYSYSSENSFYILNVTATDSGSGIKQLKYLSGEHVLSDFRLSHNGITLLPDETGSVNVYERSPGYYTFYAVDYRGNKTIFQIFVPDTLIEALDIDTSGLILDTGEEYPLSVLAAPAEATETIDYSSSRPSVARIDEYGVITAVSPGVTIITASTGQGLSVQCIVFVNYKK